MHGDIIHHFLSQSIFLAYKKELRAIHEFLADRYAVSGNDKWNYAELLLMQTLNTQQSLVNPFFNNQIKRRIAMITNSKKPGHQYLRKVMVLPWPSSPFFYSPSIINTRRMNRRGR